MYRALVGFLAVIAIGVCFAQEPPLLLRHPTISATQIAFAYAGDLWTVPREGGVAVRLTAGPGIKSNPVFSPDGTEIAFTCDCGGNLDVYIIPSSGGTPRRLTYHPADDEVIGWTRDGKNVLFASTRNSYSRFSRLFTIPSGGGFPTELPLPIAAEGSYSPDGAQLAYVPLDHAFEIWKRYRGGQTSPVWIARLSDSSVMKVPRDNSNDFNPLWIDHRIFFLSDRNGAVSLFAYDTQSKTITEPLKNSGLDFKYASAGPDAIVIEQFGAIHVYDLKTGRAHKVDIRVFGDLPELRPHYENVADQIRNADISPNGVRAVFEARGEILTVPAEKGDIRNLTNTPGANERMPAWSPDGTKLAYFSDRSGDYQLYIEDQSGMGEVQKIDLGTPPSFYFFPTWSPDGKKIAYTDKRLNLWYVDLDQKTPVRVFHDRFTGPEQIFRAAWSPDSKWLAYTQQEVSHMRSVFLYSLETGKSDRITDGMSDSLSPVFDRSGKYLYLLSSTDAGPTKDSSMLSYDRPVTSSVYVVVLRKDLPSPIAPESDEENTPKPEPAKAERVDKPKPGETPSVKVDFEKIGQRILALPIPAADYSEIIPGNEGVLYLIEEPLVKRFYGQVPLTINRFDLTTRKTDKLLDKVLAFYVSANGERVLYRLAGPSDECDNGSPAQRWAIATVPPPKPDGAPVVPGENSSPLTAVKMLNLASMEVRVDPPAEWQQMYHEAFRLERDFFYDPGFHGLDLAAEEKSYSVYVKGVASRDDLNYIFREAMGDLSVGHLWVRGGDEPETTHVSVGLLGADYTIANDRYRFARIYDGENWNPKLRAPLTQPGVNVVEGEYLLAVNGRELRGTDNIYSFFENTAHKSVVLRVGLDPSGAGSRDVAVVPVGCEEQNLRNLAWIESNRRKVDELSNGKLAYIYLPDTADEGYAFFNRYFFSQAGKEGAVVDERFNDGGDNTDYILDYLRRTLMNYRTTRDGEDMTTPVSLIQGPKGMIINEYAGSGGDAMPWHFRQAKIGVLVGKRTWGGLVGFFGPQEQLMDGGIVTTPSRGFWTPNNKWEVENHGVAPDVEVELDPAAVRNGHDPQLEKTVDVLLADLKKNPIPVYHKPSYPRFNRTAKQGTSPAN